VIHVDNDPLKDLIINKGKTAGSKRSRSRRLKRKYPWKLDRARGREWTRWMILWRWQVPSTWKLITIFWVFD